MATNPLGFILELIKPRPHTRNVEKANHRNNNSCGLCALCGEFA